MEKNRGLEPFRFLDGPITANNAMGVHHTWGRTIKDTVIRYKAMTGHSCHYRNGFDTQGLWVEVEVEKELGFKGKRDIEHYGMANFTRKCVERIKSTPASSPSSPSAWASGWTGTILITPISTPISKASGTF
jgi:isoleucyl-tRNA synthetase